MEGKYELWIESELQVFFLLVQFKEYRKFIEIGKEKQMMKKKEKTPDHAFEVILSKEEKKERRKINSSLFFIAWYTIT